MGEARRRRDRAAAPPKVALGYVHSDTQATCFVDSREALLAHDRANARLLDHPAGRMSVRCGTDGLVAARNTVAAQVVASDVDWLLWIDSDMGFGPDALYQLLAVADPTARPIVGGLCFTSRQYAHDGMSGYRTRPQPTVYDWVPGDDGLPRFLSMPMYPVDHVFQVAATGSAFILIHRTVFERIAEEMGPTWYDRTPGTDAKLLGEDISLCVRAAALQFPIHVHTGVRTSHFKQQWVGEADHWRAYVPPQATQEVAVIARDPDPEFEASLRASTGLARTYAHIADAAEPWLLITGGQARFHAGWLDHALHVADAFDAKVIGTNSLDGDTAGLLVNRRYLDEECGGKLATFDDMISFARARGVYQAALGAVVERHAPATGGVVTGLAVVGEQGPETVAKRTWTVPRYAIIATHNRPQRLLALAASLGRQCDHIVILDNASDPPVDAFKIQQAAGYANIEMIRDGEQPPHLSRFWNVMLDKIADLRAEFRPDSSTWDVAILNDDSIVPAGWYDACSRGLRDIAITRDMRYAGGEIQVAHTEPTSPPLLDRSHTHSQPGNRMCPHAFVARGEAGQRADESMRWWWFDSDWDLTARQNGGVLSVVGPRVINSLANSTTRGALAEQAEKDGATFAAKWSR